MDNLAIVLLILFSSGYSLNSDFSNESKSLYEDSFVVKKISKSDTTGFPHIELIVENENNSSMWHLVYEDGHAKRFHINERIKIRISNDRGTKVASFFKVSANEYEIGWGCCFKVFSWRVE